jgi:DNA-binding CsgD family transcriptional regulator
VGRDGLTGLLRELTPRQREVAVLRGAGYRYNEIAEMLGIAEGTVWHHAWRIRQRLSSRVDPFTKREGGCGTVKETG